jgi:hypothetical protein
MTIFIAIDDTDNHESIGTGRLARNLSTALARSDLLADASVTRHQLLIHRDIPYTSHNSSACIAGTARGDIMAIMEAARDFLLDHFHAGANPGLCVCEEFRVPAALQAFGWRAQCEVLTVQEARDLATRLGLRLWWAGETGQGCIGAMAAVGLRSTGNDGRFIDLPGIRTFRGTVRVGEILRRSPIRRVMTVHGSSLDTDVKIDTQDWVRPTLYEAEAVFFVTREEDAWRPAERRKRKN